MTKTVLVVFVLAFGLGYWARALKGALRRRQLRRGPARQARRRRMADRFAHGGLSPAALRRIRDQARTR